MGRQAGLLFPLSVLPGSYGIGDFGKHAYELIDKMADAHISLWQILPLNPLGYGNSPYQPLSSHAGDEIYLSLFDFINDGLLDETEVTSFHKLYTFVDYQEVRKEKGKLYLKAFSRFKQTDDYRQFVAENSWVESYAVFKVFKSHNDEKSWLEWEDEYKYYFKEQTFSLTPFLREIDYQKFLQYYFFKQWRQLKKYANSKGISIIGDMPIYVGLDSVDVWMNQECFLLEEDGTPSFVAGVPPDYFSKFGQRWGNPLYNWEYLKETDFAFWIDRMKAASEIYDTVRIDHFRAFDTYWKVPESESTAIIGEWVEAPGYELFDVLFREVPSLSILAEDLGELRDEVYDLRDHYHLKGMYVFEFHYCYEFDFEKVVVYSGTHDNDTLVGWLDTLNEEDIEKLDELLKNYNENEYYQRIIHYCLDLKANDVIIPVWDMMGATSSSRFNVPGVIGSPNWEFRLSSFEDFEEYLTTYKNMIEISHRGVE